MRTCKNCGHKEDDHIGGVCFHRDTSTDGICGCREGASDEDPDAE